MDRVFLDANVLFSAAYLPDAGLRRLWKLSNTMIITSVYAAEEARRSMSHPGQREDLEELLDSTEVVTTTTPPPTYHPFLSSVKLPDKDQPIMLAAIGAEATHLLTGDFRHFGSYYGTRLENVLILSPADYFSSRKSDPTPKRS